MYDDLTRDLVHLGFTERESAVYVAMLRLGVATAPAIAETTQMSRPTTHDTLDALGQMGLVTAYIEDGERRFTAEPPERLLNVLRLQRREVELRELHAERILPQLAAAHTTKTGKPRIRYIEGIDGLRNMQREFEAWDEDTIQLVGYDTFCAISDRRLTRDHHGVLKDRTTPLRSILVTDKDITPPEIPGLAVRVVPTSFFAVHGEMAVCGDRVLLFSYANGFIAIEITSPSIASACRATLELAWKAAEQYGTDPKAL
ncbi:helix-turn-helix domain-containing protein [Candidatus Uhrbacteria bacterium]|nr:helix-turn-helix domain-containing protein [Candidatus Uhrbacteria bacterium]